MRLLVLGGFALLLSACDGSPFATQEDRAPVPEGDVRLEAGLYRTQVSLAGGADGASSSQFADDNQCLTEEDVQGGYREMLLAMQGAGACRFDSYQLDGERLEAVMVCEGDRFQPETEARISGTVTTTSTDLEMTVAGFDGGQGGVAMRVVSEKIGACEGGTE
ncbi:DUF3617 domain-containing protein [Alteriqipengyuania sp. 357]